MSKCYNHIETTMTGNETVQLAMTMTCRRMSNYNKCQLNKISNYKLCQLIRCQTITSFVNLTRLQIITSVNLIIFQTSWFKLIRFQIITRCVKLQDLSNYNKISNYNKLGQNVARFQIITSCVKILLHNVRL